MTEKIDAVLAGALGYFWKQETFRVEGLDDSVIHTGFVRRDEDALHLELAQDDPGESFMRGTVHAPHGVVGATPVGGVVLLGISGRGGSMRFGGGQISTETFEASTVLAGVGLGDLSTLRASTVTARFGGDALLAWAGFNAVSQSITTDKSTGLVQSATVALSSVPDQVASITDRFDLRLSADWGLAPEPELGHVVRTGLAISVEARRRAAPVLDMLKLLLPVQDLMGLAFRGFLPAGSGAALLEGQDHKVELWNAALMGRPIAVTRASATRTPVLHLSDLGGADGIRRWVRLGNVYPRAFAPLRNRFRFGRLDHHVHLLEVAAAIEFWVAAHRNSGVSWPKRGTNFPEAVGLRVGSSFDTWSGGLDTWASAFWDCYNGLKHNPRFIPAPSRLALLSESGYLLLAAALLDRAANTKAPSRAIFGGHHYRRLGELLRTELHSP